MIGVGGDERLDRVRRRIVEERLDVGQHRRPVGLQREQVVAATLQHDLGGLALAVDGVGGDQHSLQVEQAEQLARRADLVSPARHPLLAQHQLRLGGERRHHVQCRSTGRPVERAAQSLAVDRHHASPGLAEDFDEAGKAARQRRRVQQPEQPRERVVTWQPILKLRNSRKRSSRSRPKSANSAQPSQPQIDAVSEIIRTSRRSCRVAFPVRGSGTSRKIVINDGIGPSRKGTDTRIHAKLERYLIFSNAIPLVVLGSRPIKGIERTRCRGSGVIG